MHAINRQDGVPGPEGMYDPGMEHEACGVGFLARLDRRATHLLIEQGIQVLRRLRHRGADGGDGRSGDGSGIMIQIPDAFLRRVLRDTGPALPPVEAYGLGMFFMPTDSEGRAACRRRVERQARRDGLRVIAWREVPVDAGVPGPEAATSAPSVHQAVIDGCGLTGDDLERKLFMLRRGLDHPGTAANALRERLYTVSCSCRTVVYKGMLTGSQLWMYYRDLRAHDFASAIVVAHERFSTNTFPSWRLAQPFRMLAHNGEINTLRGNLRQMEARADRLGCGLLGGEAARVLPVIAPGSSDSAALDNMLELLRLAGRSLPHAMMMLMPQAWGESYPLGPDLRGFYEFHAGLMEPWDGPAAVVFSDGRMAGAMLDRNGLRPARYQVTREGLVVLASESGVLDIPTDALAEQGALRPGEVLLADLEQGRLRGNAEVKSAVARARPYRRWVEEQKVQVHGLFGAVSAIRPQAATLLARQGRFGYTQEDLRRILAPMAQTAHDPIGAMGCDTPPAVCSERPQLLFNYFKQLFAQVTNPAIDPARETLVMSLMTFIGNAPDILEERPEQARLIKLRLPILTHQDLDLLRASRHPDFRAQTLSCGFPARGDGKALREALERLCRRAANAIRSGRRILVLSDRRLPAGQWPIPSLLAVAAVNRHLVQRGLRTPTGVLVESGEPREVMHLALLLGYGATAVNPYLAFESVAALASSGELDGIGVVKGIENYIESLAGGLRRIMSKMGISTLRSYRGAQVFEALGLSPSLMEAYFTGTASRLGGIGLDTLAGDVARRFALAKEAKSLPDEGFYRDRRDGEIHQWNPRAVRLLQRAARGPDPAAYRDFVAHLEQPALLHATLRGMLRLRPGNPVPLAEVETAESIVRRFETGAMSLGSISAEAHEALAIAMNRLGSRGNCGEGGEDASRDGTGQRSNAIRQVASGRFGVTTAYCAGAGEIQIKIAQGAKPGEGGRLPGHKVNAMIARVRHATPGVTLISPPTQHDIYSIEDIKQLVEDLREVNPRAAISVKLASEQGIGAVAAGVVKAGADRIVISGGEGGTGAASLGALRHAGLPWEMGLAETRQTLELNGLRHRAQLQVDGLIRTGRDVLIGTLLGADSFGFGTATLVCLGCLMTHTCHGNRCPVGIATQDPECRRRFKGRPEQVMAYLRFVAEDTRRHLAELGFRRLDEAIGRCDRLEPDPGLKHLKQGTLDFSALLYRPRPETATAPRDQAPGADEARCSSSGGVDERLMPQLGPALEHGCPVELSARIDNTHRSVGARISGQIARRYGDQGLPEDTIVLRLSGTAGQSFGAWCMAGLTLSLVGEVNDGAGKGLSGGKLILRCASDIASSGPRVIGGNVLLYGATSGEAYIAGSVGERFAIRNSGARAVVEGTGDHACEYMTGGCVAVLGRTGVNFGAGMSGGIAYVFDGDGLFDTRCNLAMIDLEPLDPACDEPVLRHLLTRHACLTGSALAQTMLADWTGILPRFLKVVPVEYRRAGRTEAGRR